MNLPTLLRFWREYPALLYGIAALLGFYQFLYGPIALLPCLFLWTPFVLATLKKDLNVVKPLILSLLLMLAAGMYGYTYYQFPLLPSEGIKGKAYVSLCSLSSQKTYFGQQWCYRCQIQDFFPEDKDLNRSIAKHIECRILIPQKPNIQRPLANQDYVVSGILKQSTDGQYILKINKADPWLPITGSWNLAEVRYQAKQWVKNFIHQHIQHAKSATFLAGLSTGEFEDHLMQLDFARFGLQHIMAISGFHFAIIATLLNFFLGFFIPRKLGAMLLMFLLGAYFIFLGCSSSILRSWMMISLTLIGYVIEKPTKALNSLGIALLGVLAVNPLLCQTLGFQFSFLATAAILLLYAPFNYYLTYLLPKRPLSQMIEMDSWNQHGYYFLCLFRQGIALTIAVNLFALPLTLYYFHQFPWMSLFYNLFFPLLVSFSMFLLLVAILTGCFLPFLGEYIHTFNGTYTKWILSLISNIPTSLDSYFEIETFPVEILVTYVCVLLTGSIWLKYRMQEKKQALQDFTFV